MSDEKRWYLTAGGESYELDAAGVERMQASLDDGGARVVWSGWLQHSPRRAATEEAVQKVGREMVSVICASCAEGKRHLSRETTRRFVAKVVESTGGPLFWADLPVSGQLPREWRDDDQAVTATALARKWARAAGHRGTVPPATESVRVLLAWTGPTNEGDLVECAARCRRHGDVVADQAELLAAVAHYTNSGQRQTVSAKRMIQR